MADKEISNSPEGIQIEKSVSRGNGTGKKSGMIGPSITIHGDGQQSRCFGHVADVAEALLTIIETPQCFGQVINVGNDQEITITELANRVISLIGSRSRLNYIPYDQVYGDGFEDMKRRVPSIERLQKLTGHKMQRSLDTIIQDVHRYFISQKTD